MRFLLTTLYADGSLANLMLVIGFPYQVAVLIEEISQQRLAGQGHAGKGGRLNIAHGRFHVAPADVTHQRLQVPTAAVSPGRKATAQ